MSVLKQLSVFFRLHPLLLFLLVGGVLFALESWRTSQHINSDDIQISPARIQGLEQMLEQRYGRPPSDGELQTELAAYIDEEVLYREALRLELYRSDEVVRRRLAQTMVFIIEGQADLEAPDDSDLQALYQQQKVAKKALSRVNFRHIFFSSDRRKGRAEIDASRALQAFVSSGEPDLAAGDPFLLGQQFRGYNQTKLTSTFGEQFANAIVGAEANQWLGPFNSSFGSHLVKVESRTQGRAPDFEQQRDQLIKDWRINRRAEIRQQAIAQLRSGFNIDVHGALRQQVSNR